MYSRDDYAIRVEHERLHDIILVELVTLQGILRTLGCDLTPGGPAKGNDFNQKITEHQRMVIAGLMKRLVNQLPAFEPNTNNRTDDFQVKVANLYLLLQKRTSMKQVFQVSLDISQQKTFDDIDGITERIMSHILDYEAYCEIEEANLPKRRMAPAKILNLFEKKIEDKMRNIKSVS